MIRLKTPSEIELMKEGGGKLRKVADELLTKIKVGIKTKDIDVQAERLIKNEGGESSFKLVKGYSWTTCLPINEQVVHTPPSERVIKNGDVLTLDIGMYYKGFHTDFADTIIVGDRKNERIENFLEVGKKALLAGIKSARAGNHIGNISKAIQDRVQGAGYFILKELTGHGIGRELHEDPFVFGYLDKPVNDTPLIKPGLVIAVEVIYSMQTEKISYEKGENWSIKTADSSLSACFEQTVAVTDTNTLVLT